MPVNVAAAVAKSLEKLPADRFESAKSFADALCEPVVCHGTGPGAPRGARESHGGSSPRHWRSLHSRSSPQRWVGCARRPQRRSPVSGSGFGNARLGSLLVPGITLIATQVAISPNGSNLVFTDSVAGVGLLLLKRKGEGDPTPLAGTERAVSPFFSPDGAWIGFLTTDGKVKKIPTAGGGPITLATNVAKTYYVATWLDDNTIVFVDDRNDLRRIPADGGGPGTVALSDSARGRTIVVAIAPLPKSRGFLFTSCPGNCVSGSEITIFDMATMTAKSLVANAAGAWYSPTGHVLYTDRAGGLFAAGLDLKTLALTSGAVPVIDGVDPNSLALSSSGTAVYTVGGSTERTTALVWVTRDGQSTPVDSTWRGNFQYPSLSPDGQALTVSVVDGATHLWIRRADGTRQKLTQDGTFNWRASWFPDGRSIAFVSNSRGSDNRDETDIYRMPIDGSATPTLLFHHRYGLWEAELSRDGQWLIFRSDEEAAQTAIRARRLVGDTATVPLVTTNTSSMQAALSPDGHWLAYASEPTGQREVYLTPFPEGERLAWSPATAVANHAGPRAVVNSSSRAATS